jgi:prepilin-type processing-associated H-X9-DG protein
MNQLHKRIRAFTLVELAVVLGMLALLGAMVVPAMARVRGTSSRVACADDLKQVGVAFNSWKISHNGQYPMNVLSFRGGPPVGGQTLTAQAGAYAAANAAPYLYAVFGVMSNELGTTRILICPSDERAPATNFTMHYTVPTFPQQVQASANNTTADNDPAYFNNFKVSYFLGVFANAANMFLAGDRNIWGDHTGSSTQPFWNAAGYGNINSTEYWLGTNWAGGANFPAWSPTKMHQSRGNVLLADGSVQQFNSSRLRDQLARTGDMTFIPGPNTLLFP